MSCARFNRRTDFVVSALHMEINMVLSVPKLGVSHFSFDSPSDPAPSASSVVACAVAIKAQFIRVDTFWQDWEYPTKGIYAIPANTNAMITACRAASLPFILCFNYGNTLYRGCTTFQSPPESAEALAGFANAFAQAVRLVPDALYFEIDNEPNNPMFWAITNPFNVYDNGGNPTTYGMLVDACMKAVDALSPQPSPMPLFIPGGVGWTGNVSDAWHDFRSFNYRAYSAMSLAGAMALEGRCYHPYDGTRDASALQSFVTYNVRAAPPSGEGFLGHTYFTEFGYAINDPVVNSSETTKATLIQRALMHAIWMYGSGVRLLSIYSLIDSAAGVVPVNGQYTYGLFDRALHIKPSGTGYLAIMNAMAGQTTMVLSHPGGNPAVWAATFSGGPQGTKTITWDNTMSPMNPVTIV
jgi:hypothetical protein